MTEVTAGAETPAAEGAQPEATVVNAEATPAQQSDAEGADPQPGADNPDSDAAPKRKHWAHERIDTLTRQRHEAERQAEYWKARAEQTVDTTNLGYEEEIVERVTQRQRQDQAETARTAADSLAAEVFGFRETAARDRFADYDAVTRNPGVPITNDMLAVVRDSEVGPEIVYHLGKNIPEAARIAALPPIRQAAELGKLEARLTLPKVLPNPAPPPVQPVNAVVSGGNNDPGAMSMAEYVAWRGGK